ncbi:fumarylacetoacetate hydrolase family protein [Pseudomaricurvus alkylphenolicus]|uniref:fumarylacetoacetate hydrolase family protein n=1 Tax=Pseudomaricurvus alkylphenolicus TaxID=1306991 RepID=UPI001422F99E|nr:fumarylacetoacetate hydrolase family protein [Pseudomaricurvus alkylphenolicus]NIB40125.1 fumarylacetoacetate hydrolase family protein [Pseudomaricurvus alkylphenolicus]
MICHVVHYRLPNSDTQGDFWGVLENETLFPLQDTYCSTADFLKRGREQAYNRLRRLKGGNDKDGIPVNQVELLSPVTKPCRVLCQGANYRQHMIESGMNPDAKSFNMFFNKSSASVCSGDSDVVRPNHVQLLDYEVELGLVIGADTDTSMEISDDNIHEVIAGIVIGNDISARDVQVPQMQFFKGKSYRSFCPTGPVLCLMEKEDMHYLHKLNLELRVNGEVRQRDNTANLVFKPAESLSEFTQVSDLSVGDLVLTGTPSGCAMQIPSAFLVKALSLLPEATKWKLFVKGQSRSKKYLQPGDTMSTSIRSQDGNINLGTQNNRVVEAV